MLHADICTETANDLREALATMPQDDPLRSPLIQIIECWEQYDAMVKAHDAEAIGELLDISGRVIYALLKRRLN
jgi:hypothetical protein